MRYHVSQQLEKVRTGTPLQATSYISRVNKHNNKNFTSNRINKLTPVIVIILIKINVPEWYK